MALQLPKILSTLPPGTPALYADDLNNSPTNGLDLNDKVMSEEELSKQKIIISELRKKSAFIIDMDGVIYKSSDLIPGAKAFIEWLQKEGKKFVFLTNCSERSPRELKLKLARLGLDVSEEHFYTSGMATADFLKSQYQCQQCALGSRPSAFVIGESGLTNALYECGFAMNEVNPDYVVVGETRSYNFDRIALATQLVLKGAKLIGTNGDLTAPSSEGIVPATGALLAPIELATGCKAYCLGKPNPLIMRHSLTKLGSRREDSCIIGDNMSTDIIAGVESGIETILMLTGVTAKSDLRKFAYCPRLILANLEQLVTGTD